MRRAVTALFLCLASSAWLVFAASAQAAGTVVTTSYALAYFAERLASPDVQVRLADGPADRSTWRPTVAQIQLMQRAQLVLVTDRARERWLQHVALPTSRVVDTTVAFRDQVIPVEGSITHSHGPDGEHSHAMSALNPWLDPTLALAQAHAVAAALVRRVNEEQSVVDARLQRLQAELLEIDRALAASPERSVAVLASAPAYAYLARRSGLDVRVLDWQDVGTQEPSLRGQLDRALQTFPARVMVWTGPPPPAVAGLLAQRGVSVLIVEPLAARPFEGDFLEVLGRDARALAESARN